MKENTISYLIATDYFIRDDATKKLSFIGVFDFLYILKDATSTVNSLNVVGKLCKVKAGDISVLVKILKPNGDLFKEIELKGTVTDGDLDISAFFPLLTFDEIGKYYLKVAVNGILCSDENRFYFEVKKL